MKIYSFQTTLLTLQLNYIYEFKRYMQCWKNWRPLNDYSQSNKTAFRLKDMDKMEEFSILHIQKVKKADKLELRIFTTVKLGILNSGNSCSGNPKTV